MVDQFLELSQNDIKLAANSAHSLRKMRHAATCEPQIRNRVNIKNKVEPLVDAEHLVLLSIPYLMSLVNQTPNLAQRQIWENDAALLAAKYSAFEAISRGREPAEEVAYGISATMFRIAEKWRPSLEFSLNECRFPLSSDGLQDKNVGIFVPLAADYYQIAVLREYIASRVNPNCFQLKPIAVSRGSRVSTLPRETDGTLSLSNCSRLGVLVDVFDTGKTYYGALKAIRQNFPDKEILDSNP